MGDGRPSVLGKIWSAGERVVENAAAKKERLAEIKKVEEDAYYDELKKTADTRGRERARAVKSTQEQSSGISLRKIGQNLANFSMRDPSDTSSMQGLMTSPSELAGIHLSPDLRSEELLGMSKTKPEPKKKKGKKKGSKKK